MYGWLWEYYATHAGLEIRLFKFLPIYRLNKRNIVSARIIDGVFGGWKFGAQPWNTISIWNRVRRRWVLVEKRWWPRFLAVTPRDPEKFIRALIESTTTDGHIQN